MAKDFWEDICENYNYRFFTGIPFEVAAGLYKTMNPNIMHYIPAAHEDIAVKMATGTWLAGFKSAVILEPGKVNCVDLTFNNKNNIPILFITGDLKTDLFKSNDLEEVDAYIEKTKKSAVLTLN